MNPVLPQWDLDEETAEDAHMMRRYKVFPCAGYQEGDCCARSCFDYHSESEMRRPVVDPEGNLLYWDAMCPFVEKGQQCPYGCGCQFAHNIEERNYHPGQYCADRRVQACNFTLRQSLRESQLPVGNDESANSSSVYKRRFCAHYPKVDNCRRKEFCMFAHSREEIRAPLLTECEESKNDLSNAFFINKFKIFWCPIGVQHDWQTCVYAHNYQDARRNPGIGYGPRPCPFWEKKDRAPSYEARCPNGFRCPYSHGAKEQLYHPRYFKTVVCWDFDQNCNGCPRDTLCAFYHRKKTQRQAGKDATNYTKPLQPANMRKLQPFFRSPPFFADEPEMRGGPGRRKRDSQSSRHMSPTMSPMMMMPMECQQMPYDMSPCGSPTNSMRGGCTPVMMMTDPQQMGMMMYVPPNSPPQNCFMMPCDGGPRFEQCGINSIGSMGSAGSMGSMPNSNLQPCLLEDERDASPRRSPCSSPSGFNPNSPPFTPSMHSVTPHSPAPQFNGGMPFGGIFTMPVDKMPGDAPMSPMAGMMMVPMAPMFVDPMQGYEAPNRFAPPTRVQEASIKKEGNFSLTSMATHSGGSGSDPSLESSDGDSEKNAFQCQYLWTEAGDSPPPPLTA